MRPLSLVVAAGALTAALLAGCGDKRVEQTESRSTNPFTGTTTTKDQTTYQRGDGSTYTDTTVRH